jgi:hypothetical protein
MKPPIYDHDTYASSGADRIASTDIVAKEEHGEETPACSSEIEEHTQMEVAVAGTSNSTLIACAKQIEEPEIVPVDDFPLFPDQILIPSGGDGDDVYVAVGKSNSSLDALSWALKNAVKPGSWVYLIHVFPEVHEIPTPCKSRSNNLPSFIRF